MLAPKQLLGRAMALRRAVRGVRGPASLSAFYTGEVSALAVQRQLQTQQCSGFSSGRDNDEDGSDETPPRVNGELNPFERLLQHSQQFREQMERDGGLSFEEQGAGEDDRQAEEDDSQADEEDSDEDDDDDEDSEDEEEVDEDELDAALEEDNEEERSYDEEDEHEEHYPRQFVRRPTREMRRRSASINRSIQRRILRVADEDLDLEHQLEKLDTHHAKERKFQQLLRRKQDADRVCRNCGERGHVARNCLLPLICSNCGGIGHNMRNCLHPTYVSRSDLLQDRRERALAREAEKLRPSAAETRYERFKEEFDAELSEYIASSEARSRKRNKQPKADDESQE